MFDPNLLFVDLKILELLGQYEFVYEIYMR